MLHMTNNNIRWMDGQRKTMKRLSFIISTRLFVTLLLCLLVTMASAAGKFVLVIDAGHGGKDAGCVGKTSKEKTLTLKYALAFGKIVERNCPDVKVVYTRTTDRFLELWQRAEIANKQKADLFVSVHINSVANSRTVNGYQTYALGRGETTGKKGIQENLEVAKRENSVIYMEKDYKQRYKGFDNSPESSIMFEFIQDKNMERSVELARLLQKHICAAAGRVNKGAHQNNLAVLRLTSMPACLMELGFISNPDEEAFMNTDGAVDKYSRGFLKAFINYKNKYFDGLNVPYRPQDVAETNVPQVVPDEYKDNSRDDRAEAEKKREAPAKPKTETTAKPDNSTTEKPKPDNSTTEKPKPADDAPVFKVQIFTSRTKLQSNDSRFKGLTDAEPYEENGILKYTIGASADYNEIYRLRKSILEKFPEAFIIAFKDGQKMNVNEAIAEFKKNKNKGK